MHMQQAALILRDCQAQYPMRTHAANRMEVIQHSAAAGAAELLSMHAQLDEDY
jgi:hypothetical protein